MCIYRSAVNFLSKNSQLNHQLKSVGKEESEEEHQEITCLEDLDENIARIDNEEVIHEVIHEVILGVTSIIEYNSR